jgi:aminoglycoside 6'-N-acetyltransferase
MGATSPYSFRPFTTRDIDMIADWLQTPEVARWWGNPDEQLLIVTQDLDDIAMRQWIVEYDRQPFAYVQAYDARAWPQSHLADLPEGAEAIDTCIGVPEMLGAGHAAKYLHAFAELLIRDGATGVVIDPDLDNARARAAYARAGFVEDCIRETPDGPVVVMVYKPDRD